MVYCKIFVILLILLLIFSYSPIFATITAYDPTLDLYYEMQQKEILYQNQFVYLIMFPYFGNTEAWTDYLKPILDLIHSEQYDIYIQSNKTSNSIIYHLFLYNYNDQSNGSVDVVEYSSVGGTYTVQAINFDCIHYTITYYPTTNEFDVTSTTSLTAIRRSMANIKSDLFIQFNEMVYGGATETAFYSSVLSYLDSLNDMNSDILDSLDTLASSLNNISSNTSTNYSQQLGQISNKISDMVSQNQQIISQNEDMIEQQEDINEQLSELNDTIKDDSIDTSSSDLPSNNTDDITRDGVNNIFQSIYNAFCTGQAQDIVFPIPFTDKNITLPANYVHDMLTQNNASWVYDIIQAFWGYLIGRFIVKDVMSKINKIKSGNIEGIETTNIKGDML